MAALIASLIAVSNGAGAQTQYTVEVGRFFNEADHTKESMRFFPSALQVHQGDSVRFTTMSFHGVTLLPVDQDPGSWITDNAGGVGKAWSLFVSDPDEGAKALKANLGVVLPSQPCGWPSQPSCEFDGLDRPLNSGLALFASGGDTETKQLDFTVAINADPGETITVIDPIHPAMRMTIEVVGAEVSASDPAALAAASDAAFQADKSAAAKLHKQYSNKVATKTIKGKKYRLAWAGVETQTISLRGMYPKVVTIKKGQGVLWNFTKNVFSSHTVTFPSGKGAKIANQFPTIVCDPDGDFPDEDTATPDTAPTSASPPYCSGGQAEIEVPAKFAYAAGDGKVVSTKDFESSGVRGKGLAETATAYRLLFPKPSPKAGFTYLDMVYELAHAPMRGKVVVKR